MLGQTSNIDSVEFCSKKFKVPDDCSTQSKYQVSCDGSFMFWIYMNEQMLGYLPDQFINGMTREMKDFKKEPIVIYLLGKQAKGFKLTYKVEDKLAYQLVSYGVINGQPVLVQLSLYHQEPRHNVDLPQYARKIMSLEK